MPTNVSIDAEQYATVPLSERDGHIAESGALPDPELEPTVALWPTAGKAFKMGRTATYSAYRRGAFPVPVIECGSQLRVPTAVLRKRLGLNARRP